MGEELRQQESKIGALEEKTDRTQDNLASLSTNAKKDFRLRGKCAPGTGNSWQARATCLSRVPSSADQNCNAELYA